MKYTKEQVKEIINHHSKDLNGEKMIKDWMEKKSNQELDLSKYNYPVFCYTFPIIIDEKIQANVSLLQLHGSGYSQEQSDLLANRYLGDEVFENSWNTFSHDSYRHAYLSIIDKLILPKSDFSDNFYCYDGIFEDVDGKPIKYSISYGSYDYDNNIEKTKAHEYRERYNYTSYVFDCGVYLLIEKVKNFEGNSLGEEINKRIKKRLEINN